MLTKPVSRTYVKHLSINIMKNHKPQDYMPKMTFATFAKFRLDSEKAAYDHGFQVGETDGIDKGRNQAKAEAFRVLQSILNESGQNMAVDQITTLGVVTNSLEDAFNRLEAGYSRKSYKHLI